MMASYRTWMTHRIQHNIDGYCASCLGALLPDQTFQARDNHLLFCSTCGAGKSWTHKRPLSALELLGWTPPEAPLPKLQP